MKEGYMYLLPTAMAAKSSLLTSVKQLFFHVNLFDFTGLDLLTSCRMTAGIPCEEIESLIALYQSPDEADLFILRNRISLDIARFLKETGVTVEFQNHSASVIMAVDYIKSHLSANLSVAEICEQLFISKNTLNHYFRQELGQSIGKYIDNLIMEKAKTLLLNQTLSLGEISSRLGFCDQFYFSRKFKEKCGETPSAYRKKNIRFDM
jgi:AraC-like DNA-binding protein